MTAALARIKHISSLFLCLFIFFRIFKLCSGSEFESHVLCIIMCTQLWFFCDVLCWWNSRSSRSMKISTQKSCMKPADHVRYYLSALKSFEWTYSSDKEHDVSAARMLWQKIHDNRTECASNAWRSWRDATTARDTKRSKKRWPVTSGAFVHEITACLFLTAHTPTHPICKIH